MNHIRNFSIIAHIDHGKSTLSDRILELTQTVEKRKMKEQLLDSMELERERGITIKMQPVRVQYTYQNIDYTLNLIDTPGHVDFSYEVSRSLAAVEGAILLVDATQGIQAQTIANVYLALDQDLVIIPAVNKVDLPHARVAEVKQEICELLGVQEDEIMEISGKTGQGVPELLQRVISEIPSPDTRGSVDTMFRALIFDSAFDSYKGVIAHIRVFDGKINSADAIKMLAKKQEAQALEVGIFSPQMVKKEYLEAGDIGYIATGLKDVENVRVGDTIVKYPEGHDLPPLAEYNEPVPVVYASIFVESTEEYPILRDALHKLKLSDSSLVFEPESKEALGKGFRCGFLGMLHLDIITERLRREYELELIISTPSVSYTIEQTNGEIYTIYSASDFPDSTKLSRILEPYVKLEIMTPKEYIGGVMDMLQKRRGQFINTRYIGEDRAIIEYSMPLAKVIVDFYDVLKSATSGYASVNYYPLPYQETQVVKLDIMVAGDPQEALSHIVYRDESHDEGKRIVHKLKQVLPRQQYAVALQASIGGTIVARETLSAFRKDVTAKLYGGDRTRKDKLLKKQKEGKKRMRDTARIHIPKEVYLEVLKS
jgi:GTP-binding protein LepA